MGRAPEWEGVWRDCTPRAGSVPVGRAGERSRRRDKDPLPADVTLEHHLGGQLTAGAGPLMLSSGIKIRGSSGGRGTRRVSEPVGEPRMIA